VSEKSLRNVANHGFFGPGNGPAGHALALALDEMRKEMASRALGGICSCGRESKMEIPGKFRRNGGCRCVVNP
jgi:hypothetical protein